MEKTYTLNIVGLTRELSICKIDEKLSIAAFIMFNDVELTIACAKELLSRAPEFDIIFTAEAKGIPLAYEMSRQSNKPYFTARKSSKLYMSDPVVIDVRSITTNKNQLLFMDNKELLQMREKRVLIVDDVISTGGSLQALEHMAQKAGANVVCRAAVLAEGIARKRSDLLFLATLPLFSS